MDRPTSSILSRRAALAALLGIPVVACESIDPSILSAVLGSVSGLSQSEAAQGIRAALSNGVLSALGIVGRSGGFLDNRLIRIPLPGKLRDVQSTLAKVGAAGLLNNLEVKLNRGAEIAAPVAKNIFMDAISGLSVSDAIGIVRGPNDAATRYLQDHTSTSLTRLFTPIMQNALANTGALRLLDDVAGRLKAVPFAPKLASNARSDLIGHGVTYGLSGVFHYIAAEEAAIRANPAKRTSEILRRVFGYV
ncbi:MAG: hypothetical protein COA47_15180 [Robiginitomaculum sp.]|nr:MAG: hypothetical protein COA47_15180 [Robiginitomaculum sp.]